MIIDIYLWLWPRMNVGHLLKRAGYLLGLSVLLIGPLLYVNIDLIRQGFKPSQAGLHIEADHGSYNTGLYSLPEDE